MISRRLTLVAAIALLLPGVAGAQQCGTARAWVAGAAGLSHYDVAGGTTATEIGADLGLRAAGVAVRASYRRIMPESGLADPDAARVTVAIPVMRAAGLGVCAVGHGAGSRFTADGEEATVVAGGVGIRLERPLALGRVLPYVEARGLAASLTGQVLDLEVEASGLSLGGELGVEMSAGPLHAEAAVSLDGFDEGLGVTPYPNRLLRLALGLRF